MADIQFDTGPATLPDVGELSYNGCEFSPLFATTVTGTIVPDNARRTTKYVKYTLTVDGYVTLPTGAQSINATMVTLRNLLTAQGGALIYEGRGMDLIINTAAGALANDRDVAWGPIPTLLEFQPLGGGNSAKVRWTCEVHVAEARPGANEGLAGTPILQFNYESTVSYGEDGYSQLGIKGTLEIPLTRTPSQKTRTLTQTADDLRNVIDKRVMAGIDLSRFHATKRSFNLSRDKRTLEWDFQFDEFPYMRMPPGCTMVRGSYNVRPAKAGMGLCLWLCTLRATYTVCADVPRRNAWLQFLVLLRWRMLQSKNSPDLSVASSAATSTAPKRTFFRSLMDSLTVGGAGRRVAELALARTMLKSEDKDVIDAKKAWLIDFSFDEGLYLDSKTVTFSATWRLATVFSHILLASGIWTKVGETDPTGKNYWAVNMRDVQGGQSWLANRADPSLDVIVDFGS